MATAYEDLLAQEAEVTLTQAEYYDYWNTLHAIMHVGIPDLTKIQHPTLDQRADALALILQKRNA